MNASNVHESLSWTLTSFPAWSPPPHAAVFPHFPASLQLVAVRMRLRQPGLRAVHPCGYSAPAQETVPCTCS